MFMRYVKARIEEHNREEIYRIYITRSLQLIPQNQCLKVHYTDLLKPQEVDTRNGDQIVADIMNLAGLTFGDTT